MCVYNLRDSLLINYHYKTIHSRLVSTYEDKVLGLSQNGEQWKSFKNCTFSVFIQRILSQWKRHRTANEHWRPYYQHCDYCDIKYDFIGRVEHFNSDFSYVAQMTNISLHNLPTKELRVHPSGSDKRYSIPEKISNKDKNKKVIDYFAQLSARQLVALYNMYKIDFEMFGYNLQPYVQPFQMKL